MPSPAILGPRMTPHASERPPAQVTTPAMVAAPARATVVSYPVCVLQDLLTVVLVGEVFAKDYVEFEDKAKGMLSATIRTTCTHRVARHALHMICPLACAHTCNRQMCRSQTCMRYLTAT